MTYPKNVARSPAGPARFTDLVYLRFLGLLDLDRIHGSKCTMKAAIEAAGGLTPRTLAILERPADLRLADFPPNLVIKPDGGSSSRGVRVLAQVPEYPRAYRERMKGWVVSEAQIRAQLRSQDGPFIVEEMVTGENGEHQIPYDYKTYAFDGEIALIIQVNRNVVPDALSFFGPNFEPLPLEGRILSNWKQVQPGLHVVPACAEAMKDMVSMVSRNLRTAYVRIDMYAGRDGPMVGELTYRPGSAYQGNRFLFSPAFDEELGALWLKAAERLGTPIPNEIPKTSPARQRLAETHLS